MHIELHQTHLTIGDFSAVQNLLSEIIIELQQNETESTLHLFPELFLTGYPLQDLCLQRSFIDGQEKLMQEISVLLQNKNWRHQHYFLLGGLRYAFDQSKNPLTIENVIWGIDTSKKAEFTCLYTKQLLPSYDIFDEKKYFTAGKQSGILSWQGFHLGLLICEDMWASANVDCDPVILLLEDCQAKNIQLDAIINLSASPWHLGKSAKRQTRALEISHTFHGIPFFYVNRVGGEDEILFDGQSFIVEKEKILWQAHKFQKDHTTFSLDKQRFYALTPYTLHNKRFNASTTLPSLSDAECAEIILALQFGLLEYARKNGFCNFLVALSGGIDSALVLTLTKMALHPHQSVEAIYMPSKYSSSESTQLSIELCKNLQVPLHHHPIKYLHSVTSHALQESFQAPLSDLTDQNLQARLRGLILYAFSNQKGSMVLNTSNKSELAVGYSTQYGDSVGALSILGDVYKSEVFNLANYINKQNLGIIPEGIISRAPSAELKSDQRDEDSLPPYPVLDALLECILSYRMSLTDLCELGFLEDVALKVLKLHVNSEYKRLQFCPILKIKAKSFGFGHRVPISKHNACYFHRRSSSC